MQKAEGCLHFGLLKDIKIPELVVAGKLTFLLRGLAYAMWTSRFYFSYISYPSYFSYLLSYSSSNFIESVEASSLIN